MQDTWRKSIYTSFYNISANPKTTKLEKQHEVEKTSAFSKLNWDQLKEVVRVWLQSEAEPKEFDIHLLAEYLKELAINRKIERLHIMFNFLYRLNTDVI